MKKVDIAWLLEKALLAEDFIVGNKDRMRFLKLLKQAERELKKKA